MDLPKEYQDKKIQEKTPYYQQMKQGTDARVAELMQLVMQCFGELGDDEAGRVDIATDARFAAYVSELEELGMQGVQAFLLERRFALETGEAT